MKLVNRFRLLDAALLVAGAMLITTAPVLAQDYPPSPSFSSAPLDNLVSRIALYPDPLLAQIFAAASFPDQVQDAAQWADQNRNLHGDQLADAMYQANLPFDPALQALIPFPTVLDMMAADPNWTSQLGNAVLADQSQVMDAVQRMRRTAQQYGYLQSNQQIRVNDTAYGVDIEPVDPAVIYVPAYDPYVVYSRPRPGFFVGGAIGFGFGYNVGGFNRIGWGGGFNWSSHSVIVNHSVWDRNRYDRERITYRRPEVRNDGRGAQYSNTMPNRSFDRNNGNQFGNRSQDRQFAPVAPSQNFDRNNRNQFVNRNQNVPAAPVTPNRSFDRNNGNQFGNRSQDRQVAPVAPSQNFDRNNGNRFGNRSQDRQVPQVTNQFNGNRTQATPVAPATPNRSFDRGNSFRNAAPAAPQGQNFGASHNGGSGHVERGSSGRR